MNNSIGNITFLILFPLLYGFHSDLFSAVYPLPATNQALIGELQSTTVSQGSRLTSIMQYYDVGLNAIVSANPQINRETGVIGQSALQIPTLHLLPLVVRSGVVINLPEMRMYYFADGENIVLTYPIGIGKIGRTIPIVKTVIVKKTENPEWIPTPAIKEFNLNRGIILPDVMPAGPDNPLGSYAIYLSIPTYLMHSTIFPQSVGTRASFGCIRLYESDVKEFFQIIKIGTPVLIINQPVKAGWDRDQLYLEVHHPLEEYNGGSDIAISSITHTIMRASVGRVALIDWQQAYFIKKERDGIPHLIGVQLFP